MRPMVIKSIFEKITKVGETADGQIRVTADLTREELEFLESFMDATMESNPHRRFDVALSQMAESILQHFESRLQ